MRRLYVKFLSRSMDIMNQNLSSTEDILLLFAVEEKINYRRNRTSFYFDTSSAQCELAGVVVKTNLAHSQL